MSGFKKFLLLAQLVVLTIHVFDLITIYFRSLLCVEVRVVPHYQPSYTVFEY